MNPTHCRLPFLFLRLASLGLASALFAETTLKLVGIDGSERIEMPAVRDGLLVDEATGRPLSNNVHWQLEGNLLADPSWVLVSPERIDYTVPFEPAQDEPGRIRSTRTYTVVTADRDTHWARSEPENALLTGVWWRANQPPLVRVEPARTDRGRRDEKIGGFVWETAGSAPGGSPFLLLWKHGQFIRPRPLFKDAGAQRVVEALHLHDDEELDAAIQQLNDVDATSTVGRSNLLHFAGEINRPTAITSLVLRGLSPNQRNVYGKTPLIWAAGTNQLDAISALLAAEAKPTMKSDRERPFDIALRRGHLRAALLLLDERIAKDVRNLTQKAIENDNAPVVWEISATLSDRARSKLPNALQRVLDAAANPGSTTINREASEPPPLFSATDSSLEWLPAEPDTVSKGRILYLDTPIVGLTFSGTPRLTGERLERRADGSPMLVMSGVETNVRWHGKTFEQPAQEWAAALVWVSPEGVAEDVRAFTASDIDMIRYAQEALSARRFQRATSNGKPVRTVQPYFILLRP